MSLPRTFKSGIDNDREIRRLCDDRNTVGAFVAMKVASSSLYLWATSLDFRLRPAPARFSSSIISLPNTRVSSGTSLRGVGVNVLLDMSPDNYRFLELANLFLPYFPVSFLGVDSTSTVDTASSSALFAYSGELISSSEASTKMCSWGPVQCAIVFRSRRRIDDVQSLTCADRNIRLPCGNCAITVSFSMVMNLEGPGHFSR